MGDEVTREEILETIWSGTECCPHCGLETDFELDLTASDDGSIICSNCGENIMPCSLCDCGIIECKDDCKENIIKSLIYWNNNFDNMEDQSWDLICIYTR